MEPTVRAMASLVLSLALSVRPCPLSAADKAVPSRFPDYRPVRGWLMLPASLKLGPVSAVATDSGGRVYLLQRAEPPVLVLDRDGKLLRSWGKGLLKGPHGLRIDSEDQVWVTDTVRHIVMKLDTKGKVLLTLGKKDRPGTGLDHFNRPTDVAVGPSGDIYVADGYGNSRVVKFSKAGAPLKEWGKKGSRAGEFNIPHSIRVDGKGRVYVGDRENDRVQVFEADGKFVEQWRTSGAPYGLDLHDGRFFIADGRALQIVVLDLHGKALGRWSTGTGDENAPHWVYVDGRGEVLVAFVSGHRVRKYVAKGRDKR